jgi:hypothetical protein
MSNEVTLFKSGVPSYLKSQPLNAITKSLLSGGGGGGKRISIRGNMFRLVVNGEEVATREERSMPVVIVNVAPDTSRAYYDKAFVPGQKASPACWSANGKTPDEKASDPQSKTCANCPKNVKGSGSNGKGAACKYDRLIAVVLENDMEGDLFQLSLPSQSIFAKEEGKLGLNAYATFLSGFNVNVNNVVTEMKFDTNSETPTLVFRATRPLTEEEFEIINARGETQEAKDAVKVSYSPPKETDATAAPAAPKLAKPKAEAADDEETAEPKKRAGKKEEVVPPKSKLADVLDEWDDEE